MLELRCHVSPFTALTIPLICPYHAYQTRETAFFKRVLPCKSSRRSGSFSIRRNARPRRLFIAASVRLRMLVTYGFEYKVALAKY